MMVWIRVFVVPLFWEAQLAKACLMSANNSVPKTRLAGHASSLVLYTTKS